MGADTILFAIQSAIKLSQAAQQAYVDSTAAATLALPLPDFNSSVTFQTAINYFSTLPAATLPAGVAALIQKNTTPAGLSDPDKTLLVQVYLEQRLIDDAAKKLSFNPDGTFFTRESIQAMVQIRQWGRDPNPTPLQRVAGTLVQIGVEYYAYTPGALNEQSAQGRALKALLTSLDTIDFATVDPMDLVPRLFTSTIETLAQHPDVISRNKNTENLIRCTATALATNVKGRLIASRKVNGPNLSLEQDIVSWVDVVYRSVLQGAGTAIAKDPTTYLGIKSAGESALVGDVSQAMIGFLLDGHSGQSGTLVGQAALNAVLKSALTAISSHPDLVLRTRNSGLQNLLVQTAKTLSGYSDLLSPAVIPRITESILDNTVRNLELLWPHGSSDPADHLLLTAADAVLKIITTRDSGDQWRPSFSSEDAIAVVESVFQELVSQPGWLVTRAGKLNSNAGDVLGAVFAVLRSKADNRLSPAAARSILAAALYASALQPKLLNKVPVTDQPMVAAAVSAVIGTLFDPAQAPTAAWVLLKDDVIEAMVITALNRLGATDLAQSRLAKLAGAVQTEVSAITNGQSWDAAAFATAVQTALAA